MDLISIDDLTDAQVATILDEGDRWFAFNRQPRRNDHPSSLRLRREASAGAARRLYRYSIYYLALLFAAMVVDRHVPF